MRVAFYSTLILVGPPVACSQFLIGTVRGPTSHAPLGYEEAWTVSEGLQLRAWIARGDPARAAVVVVHGLGDTLESYLEVGWRVSRRGHTVLLLDLRAHGGSEGRYTTLGGHEREDVRAAMRLLRERGLAGKGFVLMGYSMGAVAVLRAAAVEPDVRALVAEAPFENYRSVIDTPTWLPSWIPIMPVSIALAEWRADFDVDDIDSVEAARHVTAPLLAIVDGEQEGSEPTVRRIVDAHPGRKALWVAPGAAHVGGMLAPGYWPRVFAFLEENGL